MKKILKRIDIFKNFSNNELNKIAKISKIIKFKNGELIFKKNEEGSSFFIVHSGKVKIFTNSGIRKKIHAILNEGDFFGELALLGIKYRTASAMAVEDSVLLKISESYFKKHILNNKKFILKLLYNIAMRLKLADEEIENLLFKNILGRIAILILKITDSKDKEIIITQKTLAENLGTTRIPVNRVLQRMKHKNIIEISRNKIIIKDINRIKSMAGVK